MGTWTLFWLEGEELRHVSGAIGEPLSEESKDVVQRASDLEDGYHVMTTYDLQPNEE